MSAYVGIDVHRKRSQVAVVAGDAKLPGIRGDRLAAEAVVGVTVRAGGRACAAGPAGSAALLR